MKARTLLLVSVDLYCVEEGRGPPVIVHHGGPGLDHTVIAPHLQPMAERARLICYDHRGTGRSSAPQGSNPYHIDRFVGDVAELAQTLDARPFALVGHSFGGIVALHFALAHPELLTHLILISAPTSYHFIQDTEKILPDHLAPEALAELNSLAGSEPSAHVMRRSLELLAPIYFRDPAQVSALDLDSVRFGPDTLVVWDSLDAFDLRSRLGEIDVPTLVVAGAHDQRVTTARARETADALPNGSLLVMKNSGHYPFIEEPESFLSSVMDFLGLKAKKKGLFRRRSS